MIVEPVSVLRDNYAWLLRSDPGAGTAVVVDPGEAAPVLDALGRKGLSLAAILVTHHHPDHVGGIPTLSAEFRCPVFGPAREAVPDMDHPLREGGLAEAAGMTLRALETPGHTIASTCYLGHGALFCGDTLFTGGCGRLFEGTAEQMFRSLSRLASLPPETAVYCAHEYTLSNLTFALKVEPGNAALLSRRAEAESATQRGVPTVPSTVEIERNTNPFLRCGVPDVRRAAESFAGTALRTETEVFAALRRWKDTG